MVGFKSFASLALLVTAATAGNVKDLLPDNFDDIVFSGTPSLVEFFAPWCGHCKNLAPIYEELGDSFTGKPVNIAKVDGDAHKSLSTKYGISGFPTIKFFDGKSKEPQDYSGGRDLESLQKFITEKSGQKPKRAIKPPSEVQWLTDKDFKETVGKGKDVLVAFTTSWCGHCKNLAPTWERLAEVYAPDEDIVIAKVDAEASKETASEQGVSSYPTIKFFPKGSSVAEAYAGAREEKDFVSFVNEKTNAHRVVGGGLDAAAGTIAALDAIVQKWTSAGADELEAITAETKKAAADVKDKAAEYYVKVLGKLGGDKSYVEKETERLQRLLEKGGLARSKEDDLTRRINVLKKFVATGGDAAAAKEEL